MTKFIAVVSVKGGVGKTTASINLTSALSWFRRDVIVMDANFANPDIGIHLGTPFLDNTIHTALKGKHHVRESIYRHPAGIKIIPGHISYDEAVKANRKNLITVITDLAGESEAVIIDSTPGLGDEARSVVQVVDYLIIVTTPDIVSVVNSIKMSKLAEEYNKPVLGVIVNRVRNDPEELKTENIESLIEHKIIGIIPEDNSIRKSLTAKTTVVASEPESPSAIGFKKLAAQLIGEKYVANLPDKNETLFNAVMKKLGF